MDSYGKKSVGDISLVIANKALVDINPFGVAVVEAQDSMAVSCTASKARPLGEFRVVYDRVRKRKNYFEIPAFLQIERGKSRAGNSKSNKNKTIFVFI